MFRVHEYESSELKSNVHCLGASALNRDILFVRKSKLRRSQSKLPTIKPPPPPSHFASHTKPPSFGSKIFEVVFNMRIEALRQCSI